MSSPIIRGAGIFPGVSREAYDAIENVNMSSLLHMEMSPFHYRYFLVNKRPDTDPMRVGRATHVAALEPERFSASWGVWTGGRRVGKEWQAFSRKYDGDTLTEDQCDEVKAIARAATSDEHGARYLRGGQAEVTLCWVDKETGVACKGRTDLSSDVITDLKTARCVRRDEFEKQCFNLNYHARAAFYVDGHEAATGERLPFVIVAVENHEPYAVQVYTMPGWLLEMGREKYRALLRRLVECRETNHWPGCEMGPVELGVPRWAAPREDEDERADGLGLEFTQQEA